MSLRIQCLCIDAHDPSSIASFWESAIGWRRTHEEPDEVVLEPPAGSAEDGVVPDLLFLKVPESKSREEPPPHRPSSRRPACRGAAPRGARRRAGLGGPDRRGDLGRARRPRGQRVLRAEGVAVLNAGGGEALRTPLAWPTTGLPAPASGDDIDEPRGSRDHPSRRRRRRGSLAPSGRQAPSRWQPPRRGRGRPRSCPSPCPFTCTTIVTFSAVSRRTSATGQGRVCTLSPRRCS